MNICLATYFSSIEIEGTACLLEYHKCSCGSVIFIIIIVVIIIAIIIDIIQRVAEGTRQMLVKLTNDIPRYKILMEGLITQVLNFVYSELHSCIILSLVMYS